MKTFIVSFIFLFWTGEVGLPLPQQGTYLNRVIVNPPKDYDSFHPDYITPTYYGEILRKELLQKLSNNLAQQCRTQNIYLCRITIPPQDLGSGQIHALASYGYISRIDAPLDVIDILERNFEASLEEAPLSTETFLSEYRSLLNINGITISELSFEPAGSDRYILRIEASYKNPGLRGAMPLKPHSVGPPHSPSENR